MRAESSRGNIVAQPDMAQCHEVGFNINVFRTFLSTATISQADARITLQGLLVAPMHLKIN